MKIRLLGEPFDPAETCRAHETSLPPGSFGACVSFTGTMRDFNAGDRVVTLRLDHYPEMTHRFLQAISEEAMQRFDILDCLVVHRYGELQPGEPIVLCAAWAAHRAAAFDACRYLIEELKSRAPFWKKESTETGSRWVHDVN